MYETGQPSIGPFYESFGTIAINCCIEHVNLENSQIFVNAAEMTEDCKKEMECWSSSVLSDDCIKDQTRPSQCVLESSNLYVHSNPNNMLEFLFDRCPVDEAQNRARDAAMCSSDLTSSGISALNGLLGLISASVVAFVLV